MTYDEVDFDALGRAAMMAVIDGGMVRVIDAYDDDDDVCGHVLAWNGNAPEQIGEALRRHLSCPAKNTATH